MATGIGLLQMVLSQGKEKNWFSSSLILFSSVICVIMLVFFISRSLVTKGPVAPVWLMKDRNLGMACLTVGCFAMGTFGVLQLQPVMLQDLLNYPVETTGFMMAPRGLASAAVLLSVAPVMDKLDSRLLVLVGLSLNALGVWLMTFYSVDIDRFWIILPAIAHAGFRLQLWIYDGYLSGVDSVAGAIQSLNRLKFVYK